MTSRWAFIKWCAVAVAVLSMSTHVYASTPSYDDACAAAYTGGNYNGQDGDGAGGFGAWQVIPTSNGGSSGAFIGSSQNNGSGCNSGNINCNTSGNKSWGMYANSGQASGLRTFPGGLVVGQTFTMEMDNGNINGPYSANNVVEVQLMNSSGVRRWGVHFRGGAGEYQTYDAANLTFERGTGLGFSASGLRIAFTVTGANTYSVTLTRLAGGSVTHTGTLAASGDIDRVFVLVRSAGSGCEFDAFWNKMEISACPGGFPVCSVTKSSGIDTANTQNTFVAPSGNTSYSWALSANSSGASISGSSSSPSVTVNNGTTAGSYTITVTVNNNGCISSCSQTITVTDPDVTPPTVTCPPQYNAQCGIPAVANSISSFVSQGGSASDSGPGSLSLQHLGDTTISGTGCLGSPRVIERVYRVYDGSGNFTDCTQMIVLEDTQLPVVTCPAGANLTCISQLPAVNVNLVTASDNCGAATVTHVGDVQSNPGSSCNNTITRTYRATDDCGNVSECTQVFVINDTAAPTVGCDVNASDSGGNAAYSDGWQSGDNGGTGFGAWTLGTTSGTASDNGHFIGNSINNNSGGDTNGDGDIGAQAFGLYANSGNLADAFRNFNRLKVGQTLKIGFDNGNIQSGGTVGVGLQNATGGANRWEFYFTGGSANYTISDGTGILNTGIPFSSQGFNIEFVLTSLDTYNVKITRLSDGSVYNINGRALSGTAGSSVNRYRVFNFNAGSGSLANGFVNTISIDRTVRLSASATCEATVPDVTLGLTVSDNCGSPTITQNPAAGTTISAGSSDITITVTDSCGNSSQCSIPVIVTDTTAPVLTCPANVTVECSASTDPSNTGVASAIDACSGILTATYSDSVVAGACPHAKTITRTWSATDGAGNTATCVQTINVVDSTAPVVIAPSNVIVGCMDSTAPSATGSGTASDNCDVSTASTSTATVASENFNNFRATGFSPTPSATQLDSDYWSMTGWSDGTLAFGAMITTGDYARGPATNAVVTGGVYAFAVAAGNFALGFQPGGSDFAPGTAVFRGIVNTTPGTLTSLNVSYTVYVRNNEARGNSFNFSHSANGSSFTAEPSLDLTSGTASNSNVFVANPRSITLTGLSIPPGGIYYLRWSSTDVNGSGSRDEFGLDDILVTAPVVTQSGGVSVSHSDSAAGSCPIVITRTWSSTDACGNVGTAIQTISIQDVIAPTLIGVPANVTVPCTAVPAAANVTATDTCDPSPSVSLSESTSAGSCAGNYTITRTWTATDACGNTSQSSQIITVQDTVGPALSVPANATVECGGATDPSATGTATATDNCSGATVSHSDSVAGGNCPQGYVITRTWTAVDGCGNSSSANQTITVADTIAPVVVAPADAIIECTASTDPSATGSATASDACDVATVTSNNVTVGSENFQTFRGTGFSPTPSAGQLDSDVWTMTGWSDGTLVFGATATSGDFARGAATNAVTTGGIYAFNVGSGNFVLGIQPGGSDFAPGTATFRNIVNTTPNTITTLNVSYVIWVRNNEARGNSFNFSHSANGSSFTTVPALDYTSPAAADALGWVAVPRSTTLTGLSIPPGGIYYLRWNSADVSGSGSRDEFGLDDILVTTPVTAVSGGPFVSYSDSASGSCPTVITRTWSATDACGNIGTAAQTITLVDTTAPSISVPADATVECDGDSSPAATGSATGSDACGSVTISHSDSVSAGSCPQNSVITRTWTVTDACGNAVSGDQIIHVVDTTAPVVTAPADISIECTDSPDPAVAGFATAVDNCDFSALTTNTEVMVSENFNNFRANGFTPSPSATQLDSDLWSVGAFTDSPGTLPFGGTATIGDFARGPATNAVVTGGIYAFAVSPGNFILGYQPAASDYNPGTTVFRGIVNWSIDPITSLNVSYTIYVRNNEGRSTSFNFSHSPNGSSFTAVPSANYTTPEAADALGWVAITRNVTLTGLSIPPGGLYYLRWTSADVAGSGSRDELGLDDIVVTREVIEATGGPSIQYVDDFSGDCPVVITRTWFASDRCDNVGSAVQVITFTDTTAPDLVVPADTTVECGDDSSPATTGTASASDFCNNVAVSFSDSSVAGCGGTETITRTWTATDACGNSTSADQVITVVDTTAPSLSVPADATVECGGDTSVAANGSATGSDGCGSVTITSSDASVAGCGDTEIITRTWTATDECGNSTSADQVITVVDTTAPILNVPADVTVECTGDTSPASTGTATGSDGCGSVTITSSDSEVGACGSTKTITRTWTATDECGNSASADQVITVVDTTAPSLSVPTDATVECTGDTSATATGSATGSDACGSVTITSSDSEVGACGSTKTITRTWTATDECGNSTSADQVITVVDTTAPSLNVPADATVECTGDTSAAATGSATGSDSCGSVTITASDASVAGCGDTKVITRTWTATDECGNSTSADQVITVVDTTAPSLSVPADATVECGGDTSVAANGSATGSDGCGSVTITSSDASVSGCGDTEIITRTWTATDECGNSVSADQVITVVDTTAPSLSVPADATVECTGDTSPASTGTATGSDGCGSVTITSSDSEVGACGSTKTITRTWTATDECGNSASADQVITVVDTTAPSLSVPADATVECTGDTSATATGSATGSDACGSVTITSSDSEDGACGSTKTITRTWTATDSCGNSTSGNQTITVVDTTAPTLNGVPANTTVECGSVPEAATVTASDSCGSASVSFSESASGDCPQVITRTWTATDSCGNSVSASQVITVQDTTAPVLSGVPANSTAPCFSAVPAPESPTASDGCSSATISYSQTQSNPGSSCNNVITRTWTATDVCGNSSSASQTITVNDTTSPIISCPANLTVAVLPAPNTAGVTASDNCGGAVAVVHVGDATTSLACGSLVTRTYKATDACGNQSTCSQTITVAPLIKPSDCIMWHAPLANSPANDDTDPSRINGQVSGTKYKYLFKSGSTIPVQIHINGCATPDVTGNPNIIAELNVYADQNCDDLPDGNELLIDYNGVGGPGGLMVNVGGFKKYNLDTKTLTTLGCYVLEVVVTDISTGQTCSERVLLQRKK